MSSTRKNSRNAASASRTPSSVSGRFQRTPRSRRPRKIDTAQRAYRGRARDERMREVREQTRETIVKEHMLQEKPLTRGWLHTLAFPCAIATSVILICLAPGGWMKAAISVYGATIMLLFGVSAALHLGHGHFPLKVDDVLVRLDYSNIFLVIAGTCTPFFFALSNRVVGWTYIGIVWITAIIGTLVHLVYPEGLDWLFTIIYCILGLAPITIIHLFFQSPDIGPAATILVIVGGACYIAGAVCFALHKPNPWPKVFGYHELFHLGTIGGYVCHVIALFMVVLNMR